MEHELSALFDCAHGAGLTAIWGSWARFVMAPLMDRFALLGERLFHIDGNTEEKAEGAIEKMEEFFSSIHMPVNIRELGIELTDEDIKVLSYGATYHGERVLGDKVKLGEKEISAIFQSARG